MHTASISDLTAVNHRRTGGIAGGAFDFALSDAGSLDSQDSFWGDLSLDPTEPDPLQKSLISPVPEDPGEPNSGLQKGRNSRSPALEEPGGWGASARATEVTTVCHLAFPACIKLGN